MCNDETALYGNEGGRCYFLESSEPAHPIHTLYISSQDYHFLNYCNKVNRKSLVTDVYKVFRTDYHDLDYDSNTQHRTRQPFKWTSVRKRLTFH